MAQALMLTRMYTHLIEAYYTFLILAPHIHQSITWLLLKYRNAITCQTLWIHSCNTKYSPKLHKVSDKNLSDTGSYLNRTHKSHFRDAQNCNKTKLIILLQLQKQWSFFSSEKYETYDFAHIHSTEDSTLKVMWRIFIKCMEVCKTPILIILAFCIPHYHQPCHKWKGCKILYFSLFSLQNLIRVIKSNRMRWVGQHERNRPLGRPMHRWQILKQI